MADPMMPGGCLASLDTRRLRLLLFGGKGGSGKTTSAAATALYLAESCPGRKVLAVSTDPAHSLGDSFDCPIGDRIVPIQAAGSLSALEIDATRLLAEFKDQHGQVIKKLAGRGTYFDRDDIADFFNLTLPGLDELMAIVKVADILRAKEYDLIILDTAPTGHTIRLLGLPEQMLRWLHVMNMMQEKHRYMAKQFAGRYVKDDADRFLEQMTSDVEMVRSLLRGSCTTEFIPVIVPDAMSLFETQRLITALQKLMIPVGNMIINQLMTEQECHFCSLRKEYQEQHVRMIEEKFAGCNMIKMPLFPYEIRGVETLREFGGFLFDASDLSKRGMQFAITQLSMSNENRSAKIKLDPSIQFVLFGGKGGVGKTSMAAATALNMAREHADKKVLAFSADPAHSLSDCFECPVGSRATPVGGVDNLYALELDPTRLLNDLQQKYRIDIDLLFESFLSEHVDVKFDREVMTELFALSPPGLDEIMAMKQLMDFVEDEAYDIYVLDTAATGHLLRFLELPDLVRDWLRVLFKLLLKYKDVGGLTQTARTTVDLSKSIRKIQGILRDPQRSEFVAVVIPEAMAMLETEDLLRSLKMLRIPCRHIVMNMLVQSAGCGFCASKRKEQEKYIGQTKIRFPEYEVAKIPLFAHPIKGTENLRELSEAMYGVDPQRRQNGPNANQRQP